MSIKNLDGLNLNQVTYENVQQDLIHGASADKLKNDGQIFLDLLSKGASPETKIAMTNMVKSLDDGSFSTEGTEKALADAALADGVPVGSIPIPSSPTTPANSSPTSTNDPFANLAPKFRSTPVV
jgi:hypothetical protein